MANYLLDTNVIIDFLRGEKNVSRRLGEAQSSDNVLSICSHVYYEVVRGFKGDEDSKRFREFARFCQRVEILPFDLNAAKKSVEIYLQLVNGQLIEDNDIYIAATAMVNDCVLVSANTRHFSRVENLNFVNWRE